MTTKNLQQQVPQGWPGSLPEYLVYESLTEKFGKKDGLDFSYQSSLLGGRLNKGGVVLDFSFFNPPDLAINVQGEYYHYGMGLIPMQNDQFVRVQMAGEGITLIFIDENDILNDVDYFVREALSYKDHSKLGGGR
tara:strand:+ start:338 stop:742 length:405 start_codon:yes stop_codon:yes gene_type:complete